MKLRIEVEPDYVKWLEWYLKKQGISFNQYLKESIQLDIISHAWSGRDRIGSINGSDYRWRNR